MAARARSARMAAREEAATSSSSTSIALLAHPPFRAFAKLVLPENVVVYLTTLSLTIGRCDAVDVAVKLGEFHVKPQSPDAIDAPIATSEVKPQLALPGPLSVLHAEIRWDAMHSAWSLTCLSPHGNTWIDGVAVPFRHTTTVPSGALIQLAHHLMHFLLPNPESAPSQPAAVWLEQDPHTFHVVAASSAAARQLNTALSAGTLAPALPIVIAAATTRADAFVSPLLSISEAPVATDASGLCLASNRSSRALLGPAIAWLRPSVRALLRRQRDVLTRVALEFGVSRFELMRDRLLVDDQLLSVSIDRIKLFVLHLLDFCCAHAGPGSHQALASAISASIYGSQSAARSSTGMFGLVEPSLVDDTGLRKRALPWLKRFIALEQLRVVLMHFNQSSLTVACEAVQKPLPAPWWTARDDVDLLFGIYRHGLNQLESIRADPNLGFSLRTAASAKIEATEGVVVAAEEDSNDTVKNSLVFDLDAVLLTQRSDVSTDCKLEQPLPWPAPIALTTRFKRLIDHIVRQIPTDASGSTRPPPLLQALLEQDRADSSAWALDESPFVFSENGLGKGASKQHAGTAEPDQAERSGWTKRERIAFLKVVAAFGQLKSSDGERVRSTFLHCRSRSDSDLVDMCGPLFETCLKYIASTPTKARVHALPWSQPVDAKPDEHMVDVAPETIVDVAAEPVEAASEPALTSVCPFTSLMAGPTALKLTERVQLLNCLEALFALPASAEHSEAALRAQDKIRQTCYSADLPAWWCASSSSDSASPPVDVLLARCAVQFGIAQWASAWQSPLLQPCGPPPLPELEALDERVIVRRLRVLCAAWLSELSTDEVQLVLQHDSDRQAYLASVFRLSTFVPYCLHADLASIDGVVVAAPLTTPVVKRSRRHQDADTASLHWTGPVEPVADDAPPIEEGQVDALPAVDAEHSESMPTM